LQKKSVKWGVEEEIERQSKMLRAGNASASRVCRRAHQHGVSERRVEKASAAKNEDKCGASINDAAREKSVLPHEHCAHAALKWKRGK